MTIQNKRIFASILFVLISFVCASQDMPEPVAARLGDPSPPVGFIPIDGGVLLGATFALFYGVRKIFQKTDS